jgi:dTDP-glucose 4,6-dehydratase
MKILVTGARGFIASAYIRNWVRKQGDNWADNQLVAFARHNNHWSKGRLEDNHNLAFPIQEGFVKIVYGDLLGDISGLCEKVDIVINFAAKTFVDHSIKDPLAFQETNITGTMRLLEEARRQGVKKFLQVSTDEVYGQIEEGSFTEDSPPNPRNPYAACKAAADMLLPAYYHTYGLWTAVTRTENNYGPYQHCQKALPTFVRRALSDQPIQIYGDGMHVRQWLYVDDHANGIDKILESDVPGGEIWNIGGGKEITNIDFAREILRLLGKDENAYELIDDSVIRPGHDRRYAIDCSKLRKLGWEPTNYFSDCLPSTIDWFKANRAWLY